ncbi:MAG TPA: hypothetical protein DEH78_30515 [Solibacterales bacterium]|nr:hypothetical protein [Bryobacterales bacterium]
MLTIPHAHGADGLLRLTTGFSLFYAAAALAGSMLDHRVINGENAWMKPLKFGVSTALYAGTLLWVAASLSAEWRHARSLFLIALTVCVSTLFELIYIGIQAGRGQPSHFNLSTPFHAAMYSLMAVAAVALVLSGGALGVVAFLDKHAAFSQPMRWGVALAFSMSTILTILTALTMGGRLTHHVGLEPLAALRLPVLGWSLTVGDLRVPHFLATHLMQSGPLFAWMIAGVTSDRGGTGAVVCFCLAWAAVTLWVFRIVLAGRPFFAFLG